MAIGRGTGVLRQACPLASPAAGIGLRHARFCRALALLPALVFADPAAASVTFYTDAADFAAAAPSVLTEDFTEGNVDVGGLQICADPFDSTTADSCWEPDDIQPRLSIATGGGGGTNLLGASFYGNATPIVGAVYFEPTLRAGFAGGVITAVGVDLYTVHADDVAVAVYGSGGALLDSTTATPDENGVFFGVTSTQPIERIDFTRTTYNPFIGNVRFGPIVDADLEIAQSGPANPTTSIVYTLSVTNHGPATANAVFVTDPLPAQVAYVSDDCGGEGSETWSWPVGALAPGASATCHLTTTVVTGGVAFSSVASVASEKPDPHPENNSASFWAAPGLSAYYTDPASFNAAAGATQLENFDDGAVAPGSATFCSNPFDTTTQDECWSPGAIVPHLSIASADEFVPQILGAGSIGNDSVVAGTLGTGVLVAFSGGFVTSAAFDILATQAAADVRVSVFGASDLLLARVTIKVDAPGTFLGVQAQQPIEHVLLEAAGDYHVYIDDVRFGPIVDADVRVKLGAVEAPAGTIKYTLVVRNEGPLPATGVAAVDALPADVAYVSDDCGGVSGANWHWNIGALASGTEAFCTIVTQVLNPHTIINEVQVSANEPDPIAANNSSRSTLPATGAGPGTADPGFALFRSFADLVAPDETGAAFSLRSHAGKIILLQVCTAWCVPCQQWTNLANQLKQAVDQQIGAGNFLDVDLIVENVAAAPSTQATAIDWKANFDFPGPVLHAQGSKSSPLYSMYTDLLAQYSQAPGAQFAFPYYFVLAPDCDNQIALRATVGAIQFNEERRLSGSTFDAIVADMAARIVKIWQDRPCERPLLHRIDRCSVGSAPILAASESADRLEAAEAFTVPDGQAFDIGSVVAVTDAALADVTVYADSGGFPGAVACSSAARVATAVSAAKVRRFTLQSPCTIGPGDYWLGLRANTDSSEPQNWFGGIVPRDASFAFRDATNLVSGCSDWDSAGACLPEQENTELCFMLEPSDRLFASGFEAPAGP